MLLIQFIKNLIAQLRLLALSTTSIIRGVLVKLLSVIASTRYQLLSRDNTTPIQGQVTRDFVFIWRSVQELKLATKSSTTESRSKNSAEGLSFTELSPLYTSVASGSTLSNFELPKVSSSAFEILRSDFYL